MAFDLSRALSAQGKALGPHPAFMDHTTPVTAYQPGRPTRRGLVSQRNARLHADAYGGKQAIDHVYDAINLYVDALSTANYKLTKDGVRLVRTVTDGTPPDHKQGPADLYRLLDQPNEFMGYDELIALLTIDLLLVGNAYWYKYRTSDSGKPLKIFRLHPGSVRIEPGAEGPAHYEYKPPGVSDTLILDPRDVVHFKRPNPHDAWYGMGVIQGAGRAMDLELAVTDTTSHYYENRADPSLIIQSERRVPRDVFNKIGAQMRARLAGPSNAGALFILESGLKATTLDRSASEAMFDTVGLMSRDRIYATFRTSPLLFGLMDESAGQNKVADLRRDFDNSTLRPFAKKLSNAITRSVTSAWGIEFLIDHRSNLPAEEQMKVVEAVAKVPGIKVREVRRQLAQFDIDESTGDPDKDELILNMPTPQMDENGQQIDPFTGKVVSSGGLGADQPLGSEPGRPPKPENTRAIGIAGKSFGDVESRIEDLLAGLEEKALNAAGERVSVGNRMTGEIRPDDTFERARGIDIDTASDSIEAGLRRAAAQLETELLQVVEGKALKTSDIVSRVRNHDAWKRFRATVAEVLREGVLSSARSGAMYTGLTPDENIDYESIADEVINRRGGLNSVVQTLKDRVVNRIKDARTNNAERDEYNAEVKAAINDWSASQARTVAETEAVHGYNEATLVVAELSGVTEVYVTDGDDHDQPCRDADGSTWTIAEARERRLEHPRCRRAFLPIAAVA